MVRNDWFLMLNLCHSCKMLQTTLANLSFFGFLSLLSLKLTADRFVGYRSYYCKTDRVGDQNMEGVKRRRCHVPEI